MKGITIISTDNVLPIQIEKKCFFIQREERFSSLNRACNCLCQKTRTDQDIANYDFLLFEYNKFPAMAREVLLPELAAIMRTINKKISAKTAAIKALNAEDRER